MRDDFTVMAAILRRLDETMYLFDERQMHVLDEAHAMRVRHNRFDDRLRVLEDKASS